MKKALTLITFVILMIILWEVVYRLEIWPSLLFPSIDDIGKSFLSAFTHDNVLMLIMHSILLILKGMAIGVGMALVFSSLAIVCEHFSYIYNMIVSLFDMVPGVALLPLAILWFGIGEASIIFIVFHSIIWPVSRSIINGFNTVPKLYIEVGTNLGLNSLKMLSGIYIPSAFSSIISGLRVGWARAWRGLISAEMIFGTTSYGAGLGWFIMQKRMNVDISGILATIVIIVIIGAIVEYLGFGTIERVTVKKWGTSR